MEETFNEENCIDILRILTGDKNLIVFTWVTNIDITKKILPEMITVGRGRWKIENEGFNNQKNGIYEIEHLNSHNYNAIKNHYLVTQIAVIIFQLYYTCSAVIKTLSQTRKNTSSWLHLTIVSAFIL